MRCSSEIDNEDQNTVKSCYIMGISLDQWRISIGLFHNCISSSKKIFTFSLNLRSIFLSILKLSKLFSWLCHYTNSVLVLNFCNFRCFLIVLMLLLQAGDIETNPGPEIIYNLSIGCGWVTLEERRKQQKFIFVYKSVNGLVPSYISELIPPLISEITDYSLRNQNNITVPFSRTETARKSCISSSITLWKSLDAGLRNSSSVASFKHQLKNRQNNSKVPSYYLSGNRFLSVLHARLRNNCSNLSFDLFRNVLSPSSNCRCSEESEDVEHYLFRCSNYINERVILFQFTRNYHPLNTNILFLATRICLMKITLRYLQLYKYLLKILNDL